MPSSLPSFENPPVTEVVLGVQFEPISGFRTVDIGRLWSVFRDDFPIVQEAQPLAKRFETFGTRSMLNQGFEINLEAVGRPPLSRQWFISEDQNSLIQFQTDRFLHNWRKKTGAPDYPRYEQINEFFKAEYTKLNNFLSENELGKLVVNQCEITYLNEIFDDESIGTIFNFWSEKSKDQEYIGVRMSSIVEVDDQPVGRLHTIIDKIRQKDGRLGYKLELTCRGLHDGKKLLDFYSFFDLGRKLIVKRFDDITSKEMHTKWERVTS